MPVPLAPREVVGQSAGGRAVGFERGPEEEDGRYLPAAPDEAHRPECRGAEGGTHHGAAGGGGPAGRDQDRAADRQSGAGTRGSGEDQRAHAAGHSRGTDAGAISEAQGERASWRPGPDGRADAAAAGGSGGSSGTEEAAVEFRADGRLCRTGRPETSL